MEENKKYLRADEQCNWCAEPLKNGQARFCSRKCRKAKIEANKPIYKRMLKQSEYPKFGVRFDYEGNSI